jgi:hypothetical protein
MILALVVQHMTERMRAATLAAAVQQGAAAQALSVFDSRHMVLRGRLVECLEHLGYRVALTQAA